MQDLLFTKELELLSSHAKLERDKGHLALKAAITKAKNENTCITFISFEEALIAFLSNLNDAVNWEQVFGHIEACKLLILCHTYSEDFPSKLLRFGLLFLEHSEFRVRISAGDLLGTLCHEVNINIYKQCEEVLIGSIRNNLVRNQSTAAEDESTEPDDPNDASNYGKNIFHETAGWKSLETSMKGLQSIIEGCGKDFLNFMNLDVLNLIFETLKHDNRFVRETGYYLCASLAHYGVCSNPSSNKEMADMLASNLRIGLADNWSQVRLAASVANRLFFQNFNHEDKIHYFKILLPPMCLNRYYLAEGVKLYNQESWRMILETEGRKYVQMYIEEMVQFYNDQTESDNHAVREAACHCIAELSGKIEHDAVRPYVSRLLDALIICFRDESWPVRDTACVACGNFILSFPEECRYQIDTLYPLFFDNLTDPIPSVRQGGAVSLRNVAKAYGVESLEVIFDKVINGIQGLKTQKAASERYEAISNEPGKYGVASMKRQHDNDYEIHSNQQMYSCGSLAPKMKRGGGCMDHSFKRHSEPWEVADGCIYLVAEMSSLPVAQDYVKKCIPLIVEATSKKDYTHHLYFFETINKVLPIIAKGIGKQVFKQYIEQFFDVIFYSVANDDNALARTAASECVTSLGQIIGINILAGRVEQYNPSYMKYLQVR